MDYKSAKIFGVGINIFDLVGIAIVLLVAFGFQIILHTLILLLMKIIQNFGKKMRELDIGL